MELNDKSAPARYGQILAWSMRAGLAALALALLAYLAMPSAVPLSHMAEVWNAPASRWLEANALRPGPEWALQWRGTESLVLAAIAWLATCSIACLAAVLPVFHRRGERVAVVLCALQIVVLILAALGLLPGTR